MIFARDPLMALIVGAVSDNKPHRHYAIQFTIALGSDFLVNGKRVENDFHLQPVMQSHQISATSDVVILLINPATPIGDWLTHVASTSELAQCSLAIAHLVKTSVKTLKPANEMLVAIEQCFDNYITTLATTMQEPRINHALTLLQDRALTITSAHDIANQVGLSSSRFLHLFKQHTQITYRRFQLWLKLMASIEQLLTANSITDVAYCYGFSDSAHYSRTFKECFGFSPKVFKAMYYQNM